MNCRSAQVAVTSATAQQVTVEFQPTIRTARRAEYINAEFYCDGLVADVDNGLDPIAPGRWKVRRIVGNEFVCVRLSGGGPLNLENFDISYVMGEVRAEEEYVRERGPFCKGRH